MQSLLNIQKKRLEGRATIPASETLQYITNHSLGRE